jgi:polyhydroxybutyrate depolymerase
MARIVAVFLLVWSSLNSTAAQAQIQLAPRRTILGQEQVARFLVTKINPSTGMPLNMDPTLVQWSSSNPAIVSVSHEGETTAHQQGQVTLKAISKLGQATARIEVKGKVSSIELSTSDGLREFSLYDPEAFINTRASQPLPLIIAMHGGGGTANQMMVMSQLNAVAQERRMLVAYPQGLGRIPTFNAGVCCGFAMQHNVDDVGYVRSIVATVARLHSVDTNRVYATGFSNGGMMSRRLACEAADIITGIFPVAGPYGGRDADGNHAFACRPSHPVPVVSIHGLFDLNAPYYGGVGVGISGTNFLPVPAANKLHARVNNVRVFFRRKVTINRSIACEKRFKPRVPLKPFAPVYDCRVAPENTVYDADHDIVYGGGHSWPGGVQGPADSADFPLPGPNAARFALDLLEGVN